ncbi:MAG TPA: hypothetical protein VK009_28030 [Chloroflexota bacterium]|nr:hypothetical protein [Chloroflexota bacterium]
MKPQLLLPDKRIWRRELPGGGDVVVSPGDRVQPHTPVARGQVPAPPVVVPLAQAQPLVVEGQEVQSGEVIARRKKLIGSGEEVQAPIAGKVLLISEGEVLLQPPPLALMLEAQLPGSIAAVRAGWGADVEGCFGLLRGWGSWGVSQHGILGEDVVVAAEPLTTSSLQALTMQHLRAIVAGSWGEEAPPPEVVTDIPSVLFTEPLQGRPMATPIAEALQAHKGRAVALELGQSASGGRLAFASDTPPVQQCFGPGAWVRAADGQVGRLAALGERPRFFASGIHCIPADVDLGDRTETLAVDSLEWIA